LRHFAAFCGNFALLPEKPTWLKIGLMAPPTTAETSEDLLDRIALKALQALDPALTRESVIRMVKEIYRIAAPPPTAE
jgi:hypothetical protein